MQQRANSKSSVDLEGSHVDSATGANDSSLQPDGIEVEESDVTPRCIPSQPSCIRTICMCTLETLVGCVFLPLSGPIAICTALFLIGPTRGLLREYAERGQVVVGRVAKKLIIRRRFLRSIGEARLVVVEYEVPSSCSDLDSLEAADPHLLPTFRRKIRVLKSEFDDFFLGAPVELLLIPGKPKSALLRETTEKYVAASAFSPDIWKTIFFGALLTIYSAALLYALVTDSPLQSWHTFWHGCMIGFAFFVFAALICWWFNPAKWQNDRILETAEKVGEDDDLLGPSPDDDDSLAAPLLSAVMGM